MSVHDELDDINPDNIVQGHTRRKQVNWGRSRGEIKGRSVGGYAPDRTSVEPHASLQSFSGDREDRDCGLGISKKLWKFRIVEVNRIRSRLARLRVRKWVGRLCNAGTGGFYRCGLIWWVGIVLQVRGQARGDNIGAVIMQAAGRALPTRNGTTKLGQALPSLANRRSVTLSEQPVNTTEVCTKKSVDAKF